ncbi:MAG: hypothetical protein ABI777_05660, partial [Betaproteobacteria bacterium]
VALLVALGGCATHYNDANTSGGNKVGARIVQIDAFATLNGCTSTLTAIGPPTVLCDYSGPGSLATTSTIVLRDVPTGAFIGSAHSSMLLQVPVSASNFNGTYSGPINGALKITPITAPLAADSTLTIQAEAGTKLLMIETPGALGTFRFILNFTETGAAPSPLPLKVLFVGKLTANGRDYYPPVLPCTNNFAAIPALQLPTLNAYAPIDMSPVAAVKGCASESYSFAAVPTVDVIEFYNAQLDHYFITWGPTEIAILDAGTATKGWVRTGHKFKAYTTPQPGTSDVCRFYIPPALGDSHFFGRGTVECNDTKTKFPALVVESLQYMQLTLPTTGACPANTTPIYRVFSNRADANHRYMTDKVLRDLMVQSGWLAEGDGPDLVVMCAPA